MFTFEDLLRTGLPIAETFSLKNYNAGAVQQ